MGSSMRHRSKFAELHAVRKQKQAEQAGSLTRRWFVTEDLWMAGTAAVAEAQAEQVTESDPCWGVDPQEACMAQRAAARWMIASVRRGIVQVPWLHTCLKPHKACRQGCWHLEVMG